MITSISSRKAREEILLSSWSAGIWQLISLLLCHKRDLFLPYHYNKLYSENLGFGENVVGIKENVIVQSAPSLEKAEKPRIFQARGKYEQIVTKAAFSSHDKVFTQSLLDKRGTAPFNNR